VDAGDGFVNVLLALAGALVSLMMFVGTLVFRMGQQSARTEARVTELERWRGSIRTDMHEISDSLELVRIELQRLATMIEERTSRMRRGDPPAVP
jgi:hypothetical protein